MVEWRWRDIMLRYKSLLENMEKSLCFCSLINRRHPYSWWPFNYVFQSQIYSFILCFVMVGHGICKLRFPDSPCQPRTSSGAPATRSPNTIHRLPQPEVWTTEAPNMAPFLSWTTKQVDYMRHFPSWKQQQFSHWNRHSGYGFASVVGRILGWPPISSNSWYIYPV